MKTIVLLLLLLSSNVGRCLDPFTGATNPNNQDDTATSLKKINQISIGSRHLVAAQVTTSTSALNIAARATRRGITLRNIDTAITIYIGHVGVTALTGMPLKAGESIALDTADAIYCIAVSGTPKLAYIETYD